jgi:aspartyl aminopeptidase
VGSTANSFSARVWIISFHREIFEMLLILLQLTVSISFCALEALAENASQPPAHQEGNVNCIALFNHEEVGSVSTSGAESSLLPSLLNRLSSTPSALAQSISRSFLISSDMGHAFHPNYKSKHEEQHKPIINGGIVIKTNAKQRYASDATTSFIVKQLVQSKGGKVQEYEIRNDM